jgi:hypothetical protein
MGTIVVSNAFAVDIKLPGYMFLGKKDSCLLVEIEKSSAAIPV